MISYGIYRLNPCFNGRYSRSYDSLLLNREDTMVLILVLMEDTLGGLPPFFDRTLCL